MAATAWTQTTRWSMNSLSELKFGKETAQILLRDVSLRLQGQSHFLKQIQSNLNLIATNENMTTERPFKKGGVIRASMNHPSATSDNQYSDSKRRTNINHLLDWKGHLEREQQHERVMHQAHKMLRNLEVLHSDTQQLANHLLSSTNNPSFWDDFESRRSHQTVVATSMEQIRSRHATTLETMADVVLLLKNHHQDSPIILCEMPPFHLNSDMISFLRGRLAVQVLCDVYVKLDKNRNSTSSSSRGGGGAISVNCSLAPILEEAKTEATALCDAHYQTCPEIILPRDYPSLTLVRPWIHHALVELLKNALVASLENTTADVPPPITIDIVESSSSSSNDNYYSIHISDLGKGLPDDASPFEFASSRQRWDRLQIQQSYAAVRSPLSSMGVGVPSSLWLMQHFGGNLTLENNDDHHHHPTTAAATTAAAGCRATLVLPKDDTLPEYLPIT